MPQCQGCKLEFESLLKTTCCNQYKCGFPCANPCDSKNCDSWTCHLRLHLDYLTNSSCFGLCPTHRIANEDDGNLLLTKDLFKDKQDHDAQLINAISKFRSFGGINGLNCLEQLLVNEDLNISKIYPQLNGIRTVNPFE